MSTSGSLTPGDIREQVKDLVSPGRLARFFAPRSIALVGASDKSGWAFHVVNSLKRLDFDGPVVPVHPRHATAFGMPALDSLRDLDEPVDLGFVFAPTHAVPDVIEDAGAAGVRGLIVLASGFAESGAEGRDTERALVRRAAELDITLLGPNGLGFLNAAAGAAPYGLPLVGRPRSGPVGVVLQSGALAAAVLRFAGSHGIGVSLLVSMGNEAMITTADVIDHLIEDDDTKVIALFLESIRQSDRFVAQAKRAMEAGKPIVALKVGRSEAGQKAALAHTGSIAGDDTVTDAVLRQLGVIRVDSLEELLVTVGMLGYCELPKGRRLGVVTPSGGACDIIADRASDEGFELTPFAPETSAALTEVIPDFAHPTNPLDVTGYGLANARAMASHPIDQALEIVCRDPGLDGVFFLGANIPEVKPPDPTILDNRMANLRQILDASPLPVLTFANTCNDQSEYAQGVLDAAGIHLIGGIQLGMTALGHAMRWAEARDRPRVAASVPRPRRPLDASGPWSEARARGLLADSGVPCVPAELVTSAEEAVAAAGRLGMPVAMKVCSAQIAHKSDIGGVALGLDTPEAVREAYERIDAAGRTVRGAVLEGVLVSPMRTGGVELLTAVTVDPTFGPVLVVGLGGVWVEILQDTSLRMLPVDRAEVRRMLTELRGAPLLQGARGAAPVDLDAVADAVVALGECALRLGPSLQALEINPLWIDGAQVEALDVLLVTKETT